MDSQLICPFLSSSTGLFLEVNFGKYHILQTEPGCFFPSVSAADLDLKPLRVPVCIQIMNSEIIYKTSNHIVDVEMFAVVILA